MSIAETRGVKQRRDLGELLALSFWAGSPYLAMRQSYKGDAILPRSNL